jgi:hypothetical protein
MKTKVKLGESVRREIYESVHTSVNYSTYNSLRDVVWESIFDIHNLTMEPINDLTRWMIVL